MLLCLLALYLRMSIFIFFFLNFVLFFLILFCFFLPILRQCKYLGEKTNKVMDVYKVKATYTLEN